jgi:2-polyprenyl-6-methoxyphenol hydroxylase-like FAD-dependent oxidoreductase
MATAAGRQAVVIGAGMAGLVAAKALSGHFETITVLDRDSLAERPEPRPGTPQSRHTHVLLAGGRNALAQLFPGFEKELERAGAIRARSALDSRLERPGYDPYPQRDLGFDTLCLSRPLLEFNARHRIEREPNISLRSRCRVTELVASPDRDGISAVRYDDAEGKADTIVADLVVDASGRAALTLAFLESVGAAKPDQTEIAIDQAYSTAIFETPDDAPTDWKTLVHLPSAPKSSRGAFIFPLENKRWTISLGGNHGDSPPGDIDGFTAFAKELRTPTVYNAILSAKQVGEIARFVLPASVKRHFEKLEHFPRGLIPIGDSICRFNPVFGQGMSVAAQEAVLLDRLLCSRANLSDPPNGLAAAFFAEVQGLFEAPWAVAMTDFAYPKTRGDRPPDLQQRLQYGAALTRLAAEDATVHKLVAEVNHLLRPQSALRDPQLADRVRSTMTDSD